MPLMIDLTLILLAIIAGVSSIAVVSIACKTIRGLYVSRSNLHSFNRKASKCFKANEAKLQDMLVQNQNEIDGLKAQISNLEAKFAFKK